MRCITSPTCHPHHRYRQSQWIEALVYTNLTPRDNHYQRRHWSIATGYNLLLSHCHQVPHCEQEQHHLPAPLPRLSTTPDILPEEISVVLPCAASNIPTLTAVPPPPRTLARLIRRHWSNSMGSGLVNTRHHQVPRHQQDPRPHPAPLPSLPSTPEDFPEPEEVSVALPRTESNPHLPAPPHI